jgi:NADH:ubiquinone oxidoreductase subunit K
MGLQAYLLLSSALFCIGLFGVVSRRNTIGILLGIELMLNSVNINLVAFSRFGGSVAGMVFTVFTISITVAEMALGLAIVILLFRVRRTALADHLDLLKG